MRFLCAHDNDMGDSDAGLKRRVATMEAALDEVRAELADARAEIATLQGRSDGALAAMAAAVTAQASATQAQADATRAAAEARAKPDTPDITGMSPMRAAYALALALADGPAVAAGTDIRGSWHAAWALRAL